MTGLIIKGIGGIYTVHTSTGDVLSKARGIFRHNRQQLLVGDRVVLEQLSDGSCVINEILPRKNVLVRPALANLDAIIVLVSAAPPVTDPFLVDKVLAIAVHNHINAAVCINKTDLNPASEYYEMYKAFPVFSVSAATGAGLEQFHSFLIGKTAALVGNSGVGKSSILHRLFPERNIQIGDLSEKLGRGKNTTRHTELFPLEGGFIADTPGFSAFDITKVENMLATELASSFPEMRPFIKLCRYAGCTHIKEEGCAVREALSNGFISKSRYHSYEQLYNILKDIRPWQFNDNGNKAE